MPSANIVTDYGAVADTIDITAVITIAAGTPTHLFVTGGTFSAGDIGKPINVYGAQTLGNALSTTIASVTNSQNIVLTDPATVFPTAASHRVVYGTDNSSAFTNFNTWAKAQVGLVTLTIPSNVLPYWIGSTTSQSNWVSGVSQLLVLGTGATIQGGVYDSSGNFSPTFRLGGSGIPSSATISTVKQQAKISSAARGAPAVTLLDATQNGLYTVNGWVLISGIDLQGQFNGGGFGYPPNAQIFEYAQVQAISGATITLTVPISNSYLSTWPQYDLGGAFGPDEGGPATLYPLANFDITAEFRGLTIYQDGQTICNGKSMTFTSCVILGDGCIPSQNKTFTYSGCNCSTILLEVDKLVENLNVIGTSFNKLDFQSASVINLVVDSSTISNMIAGTAVNTTIRNGCTIAELRLGAYAYGRSLAATISDSTISVFSPGGVITNISGTLSMNSGTIVAAKTLNAQPWAVPGNRCFWQSTKTTETGFTIQNVTEDATNIYVQTNLTGSYPTLPIGGSGQLAVFVHPCQVLNVRNCVGCEDVVSASLAPANYPVFSWQRRTYGTSGADGSAQPMIELWGSLKKITIDVQVPFTGTGPLLFHLSSFDNWPIVVPGNSSLTSWGPVIDAKVAGTRVLTTSGWSGGQPNDTLQSFPTDGWFSGQSNSGPVFSANYSGQSSAVWPTIVVTLETDQGFSPPTVVPLRARLRA